MLHAAFQHGDEDTYLIVGRAISRLSSTLTAHEAKGSTMHGAFSMPTFGSSSVATITGWFLEPTRQERAQYRRLGQFRVYRAKNSNIFEEAESDQETEYSRIWKEKHGKPALHY